MSLAKTGKVHDNKTKEAISAFCLIQKFSSIREAGKYFCISHSNVSRYIKLGALFSRNNINYKFSLTLL